jgi:hypothetical protein
VLSGHAQLLFYDCGQFNNSNAILHERISIPNRHGLVVQRLSVDGDAEWRSRLILAAVAPVD